VKPENLAVFHHMFPVRGAESQRSFSWQHFLGAMVDTGFTIVQSQGSAVTLKLEDHQDHGVNAIVLHRPHPKPIVNPVMLRRIAKRMQKWFGWQRETFVEKQK
jgi:predicted RNA binding protein YcfA (HicA-like mRNA interferase family)